MDVLAFPFSFTANGRAALVAQDSDAHMAQQISQFVQTRLGELLLAPAYGLVDPIFRGIDSNEIVAGVAVFHPKIRIVNIDNEFATEGTQSLNISYERQDDSQVASFFAIDGEVQFNA